MTRLIFDSHLDLGWSAVSFNRDLTRPVDERWAWLKDVGRLDFVELPVARCCDFAPAWPRRNLLQPRLLATPARDNDLWVACDDLFAGNEALTRR